MQASELITEISMLEEEVTNREQYILSLYRNIFDQCVVGSLSTQNSSKTSPAHANYEDKNLPSTISRTLCTTSKFPPPQHYVSSSNQGSQNTNMQLQSKTMHASLLSTPLTMDERIQSPHSQTASRGQV